MESVARLDWLGLAINIVAVALSGLFAAFGGHLAGEAIDDPKRVSRIKKIFWFMFGAFMAVSVWQQFRLAEADMARDTKETWAEALVSRGFLGLINPPSFAFSKTAGPVPLSNRPKSYLVFLNFQFPGEAPNPLATARDF